MHLDVGKFTLNISHLHLNGNHPHKVQLIQNICKFIPDKYSHEIVVITYLKRKFPKAGRRTTIHHSLNCEVDL